jgi:hypothetical protein
MREILGMLMVAIPFAIVIFWAASVVVGPAVAAVFLAIILAFVGSIAGGIYLLLD